MEIQEKDLLGLRDLPRDEIELVLKNSLAMEEIIFRDVKKLPTLRGRSVVSLFYESSTRTRASFELAGKYLSADTTNLGVSGSSVNKGETLIDTGRTLDAMGINIVVIRHPVAGAPKMLGENIKARVINAGDGSHEHPTQALLDMHTMIKRFQNLEGLKVAIIGDITHSRVARSNIWGLTKMGAEVVLCGPPTLIPVEISATGAKVVTSLEEALKDADVVMMLRIQFERQEKSLFPSNREYSKFYGLNDKTLKLAKKDVMVMHPGPINRGIEISPEIYENAQSVIDEQVTSGVAVRMALLYLMGGSYDEKFVS